MDVRDMHQQLLRAIAAAGGQSAFAQQVGCTQGNIWQLIKRSSPLPGRFVLKAEAATGVSRHDLRPDLYPHDDVVSDPSNNVVFDRGSFSQASR